MGKTLVVIGGPTAVGKTNASLQVAENFKTEIISADSRQVYRELNIGTAKPTDTELQQIKHHFINSHSIHKPLSAGQYEEEASEKINMLFKQQDILIATGGSGLYIKALTEGLDQMPSIDPATREELNGIYESQGLEPLVKELEKADPELFDTIDLANPRRLIRALEVFRSTGTPLSQYQKNKTRAPKNYDIIKVCLEQERATLYERIENRMDKMLDEGLVEEVRGLLPHKDLSSLQTLGYSEVIGFLQGNYDYEECVRLLKRNSRRYAKRQMTWFKNQEDMKWFDSGDLKGLLAYISSGILH